MANDLKRSFELLEALLPAFFNGFKEIFEEDLEFNTNSHPPITASLLEYQPLYYRQLADQL